MTDVKHTPWYLLLPRRSIAAAIKAAQWKLSTTERVEVVVFGIPVSFTEDAVTCLCALQALRRGKIHRQSIPEELRQHCKDTGTPITWSHARYSHILADIGARIVLAHLNFRTQHGFQGKRVPPAKCKPPARLAPTIAVQDQPST